MRNNSQRLLFPALLAATTMPGLTALAEDAAPSAPSPAEASTASAPPAMPAAEPEVTPAPAATPMPVSPTAAVTAAAPAKPTGVSSKFAAELYGFVELDSIHDSTETFDDLAGNKAIQRGNVYAGSHQRTMFGARNSRIGFKMKGPESDDVKTSAIMEMDFFGNQPSDASQSAFFVNPTFRIRHFALKLETPIVDILFGQYWQLFGWQSMFHPNSVQIQGLPGQVYSRTPQIRVSKTIKTDPLNIEIAVAASRPVQRDGSMPDGQAGLKLVLNDWKGLHTAGSTGTAIDGAAIGVSGIVRRFELPEFAATPVASKVKYGSGVSIDALIPVIPATPENRGNSLTLTGSFVRGTGIADLYSGLSGGISFPAVDAKGTAYAANVDSGLVVVDDVAPYDFHTINWLSYMAGFQYYLPPSGSVWISGNISGMQSSNLGSFAQQYGTAAKVFDHSLWADGNLFVDVNKAVRLGAEFAYFRQTYADGQKAHNYRGQFSAFYIF